MRIDDIYARKCAEKSDINEHLPALKAYAEQCDYVTEFGMRDIVSTWALIAGRPFIVTSYDKVPPVGFSAHEVKVIAHEADVTFDFWQKDVLEVEIIRTDLLFIDTRHTFNQLRQELAKHSSKVAKWIILHDTVIFGEEGEEGELGLNYAIREFVQPGNPWQIKEVFANNNGLTVLERK